MRLGNILNWTYIYLCILTWAIDTILGNNLISPLHIDVAVLFMACLVNSRDAYFCKAFTSGPIMIWGLWTIYSIVNWFICPYDESTAESHMRWYWNIFSLSKTYFMLVLIYYEACRNLTRTIKFITYAFILYLIIGIGGQWDAPMREEKTWEGRNGTILGNHFPLNMLCSLFVLILGNIYGYIKKKQLIIWMGIVTFVIFWVATRKAMGGMFIIILFYIIARIKILSFVNLLKLFTISIILILLSSLIMDYTLVGLRINTLRTNDNDINQDVPVWLEFLGDRAIQYVKAWEVFRQHPINGVGLGNSMNYTGLPFPIHSEYMEQLCEGGIIGAFLYLCFIFNIIKCIRKAWVKRSRSVTIICIGGMSVLLFLSFTTWVYNIPCFFIIYALVIAYCNPQTTQEMPYEYIYYKKYIYA